ncbi:hypothetical protein NEFER03_0367 [Nematocida sp. LUAm3]|nr:hypothetical protein NEFER03_0367 [Nematocida sp. LUAm3]KAI5176017.1 hypothetical protein NEFER02_1863 [Nematocida sp. LUAm2]KAI5179114.1 hypothetical protein NEFER01_1981 [Nematocida sp. LUAm1]
MEFLLLERNKELKRKKWYFIRIPREGASERIRELSRIFPDKPVFLKRAKFSEETKNLMVLLFSDEILRKSKELINGKIEEAGISNCEVEEIDIPVEDPEEEELRKKACEVWPSSFHPVKKPHLSSETLKRVKSVLEIEKFSKNNIECSTSAYILRENSYEKYLGNTDRLLKHPVLSLIRDTSKKTEGYLCTDRIVILSSEPCLVCGMALLHSRIKKVFIIGAFSHDAPFSSHYLHDISQLNHRFLVYFNKDVLIANEKLKL